MPNEKHALANAKSINQLPSDIWLHIFLFLPYSDLARLAIVCFGFRKMLDNAFWGRVALREGLTDPNWGEFEEYISNKLRVKTFLEICQSIEENYPEKLCQALGGSKKIALLPSFTFEQDEKIPSKTVFQPSDMMGHKIKRGFYRNWVTHYLGFCFDKGSELQVSLLYKRYPETTGDKGWWHDATPPVVPMSPYGRIDDRTYAYLARLSRGEPCGSIVRAIDCSETEDMSRPVKLTNQLKDHERAATQEEPSVKKRKLGS